MNSIDNIADKVLEYQSDKSQVPRSFARKIDHLIYKNQQEEERLRNKVITKKSDKPEDQQKEQIEQENLEILELKKKLSDLTDKFSELKEKVNTGKGRF